MPEHQQIQQSKKPNNIFQKQTPSPKQIPTSNPIAIIQRAKINPKSLTHADVMQLQRTIGNRAVGKLLSEIGLIPSISKPVQRQEIPKEEETCPSCVQRQEIPEEEEPLQGKMTEIIQKQEIPEEEEPLQGKMIETVQRQEIPEEEEPLQGKMIETVQRQEIPEEEEPLQGKMAEIVQRQEIPEEEEPLQCKFENPGQVTCPSCSAVSLIQRQETPVDEEPLQTKRENNTGMPDNLKAGVENLSGIDMSDVRVHYNSDKPAEVGALAYTQGTDIHVVSGQERHLPHEAWHVVQQMQGRVKPTVQFKDGTPVNDDEGLEHEADVMGVKAQETAANVENFEANKINVDESAVLCLSSAAENKQESSLLSSNPHNPIQLFDWKRSTALTTIGDFFASPSWQGAKDLFDPRRARLNPLNLFEGWRNMQANVGNYHTNQRHGAHHTVRNVSKRLQIPSTMLDTYQGGIVPHAGTTSRFNSEAWESFSWRKAKELFVAQCPHPVTWVNGPFNPRSACNFCLNHVNSDVGISQAGLGAAINSVSGVRVAVNYRLVPAVGAAPTVDAYNGQMFPVPPVAPNAGQVQHGDPNIPLNGTLQPIPYKFLGYFGV